MDNPPNTNIHTIVRAQIVFLLSTLTEENFERNQTEIRSLSEQHGLETYLHFIRRLIVHSQQRLVSGTVPPSHDISSTLTFRLLVQETQRVSHDPSLSDRFREGIDRGEGDLFRHFDLGRFTDRIGLRPLEKLVLATSFLPPSTRRELAAQATTIIRHEFDNAVVSLCHSPSFDHGDLSLVHASKLVNKLLSDLPPDSPVLDPQQRHALIVALQTKFGQEHAYAMLQRIIPTICLSSGTSLVQFLSQLGQDVTGNVDIVRAALQRFGISETSPPRDAQVVDIISSLARLAAEGSVVCDVGVLVRVLSSMNASLTWASVIKSFDSPDRHGVDTATLKLLIAILLSVPRDGEPHAVTGFWETWSNQLYHLRLLDALLSLPPDTFNFVQLPGRRIVTVDDVSIASPTIKALAANVQGHTWNSLDLFEVLVRMADSDSAEVKACVRDMLDKAIKISAELVHMGLFQVPSQNWNEIRKEYCRKLLSMFLAGHPNHQLVFMRIWQIEPKYLTDAFCDFYDENPLNISRILDVAQDLKILESLLEVRPFTFALDVAALASRREYLNLDKWLADNAANHGSEFLHSVIVFLDQKMESEKASRISVPPLENRTMPLSPSTITIILRMLRNNTSAMTEDDAKYCLEVRNACLQIHPRLMDLTPGSEAEPGFTVINYSPEIEAEVDAIYKQMYDENTTIDEVIVRLQQHKDSVNARDHEVFSCMLHFLFDEYKFFQSYYPARELSMTGYLFGSLIQHQLIDYIPLGIAIRYILDALHCPPETNLFKFGTQALSQFESRLSEWQPLCEALLKIPHLTETRPDLVASIQRALTAAQNGSANDEAGQLSGSLNVEPSGFTAIQPDEIEGEMENPPEELSDRFLFIVNNLAPNNFDAKLNEMKTQFEDTYARWFANYLVDQRVSVEANNHQLYLRFLDALDRQPLMKFILQETFVKSAALLNSEKAMQAGSTERTMLKNVGKWLGEITLARDRPIRHKNLSFKDLLVEGYDNGRLVVAIPFVCQTMVPCQKSKVFKPPNPWLMGVLGLLAELYQYADMKLNLKFEIEVLCQALNVTLDSVEPTNIIRNRPLGDSLAGPPLPDYVPDIDSLPIGGYHPSSQLGDAQVLALGPSSPGETHRALGAHVEAILANLLHQIFINAQLAPLNNNPAFKRAVQMAVDRAVREIILPVVERSVTIAGISARELVTKDFATEPNEERFRKAGHLMAQRLAGSLALVTCKEPLKSNLTTHLRQYLADHGFGDLPEPVIMLLVTDNLDIACSAIEKSAMDQAITDADENFASSYEIRRRHRELRNGQPFWDPSAPQVNFSINLPDPLRVKPTGLQPHQISVYEDFANDPKRRMTSRPSSTMSFSRNDHLPPQTAYTASPAPDVQMSGRSFLSHAEAMERFSNYLKDLEAVLVQLPVESLAVLPPNHDVRHLVRQILFLSTEASERQRTPLQMSQKIVQFLYKTQSQLGREVYVVLLEQLCNAFEDVSKEAITWLVYAEDERKFNVPVTVTLLRSGLVDIALQDQQLAKFLYTNPRPSLLAFAAGLIRECLSADPPVATQTQFSLSLEILNQLSQSGKASDDVTRLLSDLNRIRRPPSLPSDNQLARQIGKAESDQSREKLVVWFQQWINIFQRYPNPEKNFVPFINALTKQGILKVEDMSSFFFRVCTEASVTHYIKCVSTGDFEYAFQALDAMSRLIVYIIKYHGDASGVNNDQAKVHYLTKILSIFVLVLANVHEDQGPTFQQKPFFRFFSSLINDLHTIESSLGTAYFQLLIAISDTFSSLQPTYFPGFAFSWMCLISHRLFMPKLLLSENREQGWSAFHKLLLSLFKFLSPFLKDADLRTASRDLYRGTLRLLLVLLHDFPEFLSEYYFTLCDAIPPRCIQLRNIILSAFPSAVVLPDPHLRNVKFESIPEMGPIPPILSDFTSGLKSGDLRLNLDQYLLNRGSPAFLPSLKDRLRLPGVTEPSEETYNLSLINSLVMYIGVSSVAQAKARSGSSLFVASDPGVVALQYLATSLDIEGQHHLLSSFVLHLRYPNAHTHWFSSLLLHLFLEVKDAGFREVMTKVLLERFIALRPHPWGALVTFIELLRNPKYDFWSMDFIRIAPEVSLLLESVYRSLFQS